MLPEMWLPSWSCLQGWTKTNWTQVPLKGMQQGVSLDANEMAQMVEQELGKIFCNGPELKFRLGKVFL